MGDRRRQALHVQFDGKLKLEFHGALDRQRRGSVPAVRFGVQPRESAAGGLINIGAKVVRHSKYLTFQMAEVAVPRELFAAILDRIQRFGVPPPLVQRG